ncbi:MAG: hypothetical protein OXR68_08280 [Alphaproteobacteria bacterium]|nr:hypothetical protein [Alphaproteobacteria bacterium]MDD9920602.1 hypothetical protein [Alphaproteobacteria bacterium]
MGSEQNSPSVSDEAVALIKKILVDEIEVEPNKNGPLEERVKSIYMEGFLDDVKKYSSITVLYSHLVSKYQGNEYAKLWSTANPSPTSCGKELFRRIAGYIYTEAEEGHKLEKLTEFVSCLRKELNIESYAEQVQRELEAGKSAAAATERWGKKAA